MGESANNNKNNTNNNIDDNNKNQDYNLRASSKTLQNLYDDVEYLWTTPTIPVLKEPPSKFIFLRDYVSKNVPCIIQNAITTPYHYDDDKEEESDASNNGEKGEPLILTLDDIVDLLSTSTSASDSNEDKQQQQKEIETMLTVDVTPDGRGDCIRTVIIPPDTQTTKQEESRKQMFVKPCEEQMNIKTFRDLLREGRYAWKQKQQVKLDQEIKDEEGLSIYPLLLNKNSDCGERKTTEEMAAKETKENQENQQHQRQYGLNEDHPHPVLYYSRQNDRLRTELKHLFDLNIFPSTIKFAQESFGGDSGGSLSPDAINLWIGDERATSSMHKDHYENLFYVLSGEKVFTLCPPVDAPFLYEGEFDSGTFHHFCRRDVEFESNSNVNNVNDKEKEDRWSIVPDCNDTDDDTEDKDKDDSNHSFARARWILPDVDNILPPSKNEGQQYHHNYTEKDSFDVDEGDYAVNVDEYIKRYPLLRHTHPFRVSVKEGQMLYLPSLWYHRVTQTMETVGINYWYDMRFDSPHWCYFNFMQQLKPCFAIDDDTS